jgi:putative endonuclease
MASQRNGTLYVGVTSDLLGRGWKHKNGIYDGFTKKYGVKMLVWYEAFENVQAAIQREKTIKKWPRKWKLNTIESMNPAWRDLYDDLRL